MSWFNNKESLLADIRLNFDITQDLESMTLEQLQEVYYANADGFEEAE
jgi:hypothetical protein